MKKTVSKALCLLLVVLLILPAMSVSASTVTRTKHYTIVGLESGNAVQKAVIYGGYIYVIQHNGKDSWLTQCKISGETATRVGKRMVLKNFGHAQSLEAFEYRGKTYFWVNCKNNSSSDWNWGIQVARIQFEAGKTVKYTSCPRLTFGSVDRVEFALSSNTSEILFWVKDGSKYTYSAYKTAAINKKLDEKEKEQSHYINVSNFEKIFSTTTGANLFPKYDGKISNQGLEFTNKRSIYAAGGHAGDNLRIFKLVRSGNGYKLKKSVTLGTIGKKGEIEGLQIKGDRLYFCITDKSKKKDKGRFVVYSILKSEFD
jgi:hypothetical protein